MAIPLTIVFCTCVLILALYSATGAIVRALRDQLDALVLIDQKNDIRRQEDGMNENLIMEMIKARDNDDGK